jgi:hypothetical protein
MEHLDDHREAVRRAGRIGNDVVFFVVVTFLIGPEHGREIDFLGRRRNDDLLHGFTEMDRAASFVLNIPLASATTCRLYIFPGIFFGSFSENTLIAFPLTSI